METAEILDAARVGFAGLDAPPSAQEAAIENKNMFVELVEATKVCSLGQITEALFEVGGQYRRNM